MTEFKIKADVVLSFNHIIDSKDRLTAMNETQKLLKSNLEDYAIKKITITYAGEVE